MVNYICSKCGKKFTQKSHYDKHQKKKNPCVYKDELKKLIEEVIDNKSNNNLDKEDMIKNEEKKESKKMIKIKIVNKPKTIVETFVGCGGAHLGFKNNNFKTLLVNDINMNMINTLLLNNMINEDKYFLGPIRELTNKILDEKIKEDVDVLFGGIVCKGFSLAGVRNPFDERNYLYVEQLRLVEKLKPKVSVIENVVGLKKMKLYRKNLDTEKTFSLYCELSDENKNYNGEKSARRKLNQKYDDICDKIKINKEKMKILLKNIEKYEYSILDDLIERYDKLGYNVYHEVLSVNEYGGYTTRKRFIIVAVSKEIKKKYVFPSKQDTKYTLQDCFDKIDYKGINNPEIDEDNKPMKHNKKTIERFKYIEEGKNISEVIDKLPEHLKISKFFSRGNTSRLDRNKPVPTLVPGHSNFPIHPTEHRSISVREAACLTGFPNDYKFYGSHTSRCEQVGNSVPVQLSNVIAKSIIDILE